MNSWTSFFWRVCSTPPNIASTSSSASFQNVRARRSSEQMLSDPTNKLLGNSLPRRDEYTPSTRRITNPQLEKERQWLEAARSGKQDKIQALMLLGIDVDHAVGRGKNTALIEAIRYNQPDLVDFLLDCGASPTLTNKHGESPLSIAAAEKEGMMLKKFLDRQPELLQYRTEEGKTLFLMAARSASLKRLQSLAQRGVDIHAVSNEGENAASIVAMSVREPEGEAAMALKWLLQKKVSPNQTLGIQKATPLHLMVSNVNLPMVKFMVELGKASVDATDKYGNTPLLWAARQGNIEVTKYLLSRKANVLHHNDSGQTAADLARQNHHSFRLACALEGLIAEKQEKIRLEERQALAERLNLLSSFLPIHKEKKRVTAKRSLQFEPSLLRMNEEPAWKHLFMSDLPPEN